MKAEFILHPLEFILFRNLRASVVNPFVWLRGVRVRAVMGKQRANVPKG